jgi:hypothetical protein
MISWNYNQHPAVRKRRFYVTKRAFRIVSGLTKKGIKDNDLAYDQTNCSFEHKL